ncbi:unnamed protein product, partial [Phaeothamnion confervicola]
PHAQGERRCAWCVGFGFVVGRERKRERGESVFGGMLIFCCRTLSAILAQGKDCLVQRLRRSGISATGSFAKYIAAIMFAYRARPLRRELIAFSSPSRIFSRRDRPVQLPLSLRSPTCFLFLSALSSPRLFGCPL